MKEFDIERYKSAREKWRSSILRHIYNEWLAEEIAAGRITPIKDSQQQKAAK